MSQLLLRAAAAHSNEGVSQETPQADEFSNGNNTSEKLIHIPLDWIRDNPYQTRLAYTGIEELAADIQRNGLLQPPTGRLVDKDSNEPAPATAYTAPAWEIAHRINTGQTSWCVQLAIGHRRQRACRQAGLGTMPIFLRPLTDQEMARQAWSENAQRKDISSIEEARAIQMMMAAFAWTQTDAAAALGLDRSTVSNKLRLLGLPEAAQLRVIAGELGERHARALLTLADAPETLNQMATESADKSLTVRELESAVATQRQRIDAQREKERQYNVLAAAALGVPQLIEWTHDSSVFCTDSSWASAVLLQNGQCGPGLCECLRIGWRDSPYQTAVCPLPDDAPNFVWVCCDDKKARTKTDALRKAKQQQQEQQEQQEQADPNSELARRQAEKADQEAVAQAEKEHRERMAEHMIAAFVQRHPLPDLWQDIRFWLFVAASNSWAWSRAVSATDNLPAAQRAMLKALLVEYHWEKPFGHIIDLSTIDKNRRRLLSALGDKPASPQIEDDDDEYDEEEDEEGYDEEDEEDEEDDD